MTLNDPEGGFTHSVFQSTPFVLTEDQFADRQLLWDFIRIPPTEDLLANLLASKAFLSPDRLYLQILETSFMHHMTPFSPSVSDAIQRAINGR